jgi:hypothetical protein
VRKLAKPDLQENLSRAGMAFADRLEWGTMMVPPPPPRGRREPHA